MKNKIISLAVLLLIVPVSVRAEVAVLDHSNFLKNLEIFKEAEKHTGFLKDIQNITSQIKEFQSKISEVMGLVSDPGNLINLISGDAGGTLGSLGDMVNSAMHGNFGSLGLGDSLGGNAGLSQLMSTISGIGDLKNGFSSMIGQMRGVSSGDLLGQYSLNGNLSAGDLLGSLRTSERAQLSNSLLAQSAANTMASSAGDMTSLRRQAQKAQSAKTLAEMQAANNAMTATGVGAMTQGNNLLGSMAGLEATRDQREMQDRKAEAARRAADSWNALMGY